MPAYQGSRGVDLEAVDAGYVTLDALSGDQGGVDLEDDVVEGGAEVGTIDSSVAGRLGVVNVLAPGAIELHRPEIRYVRESHRQERVAVALDAGALPELGFLVFLKLFKKGKC